MSSGNIKELQRRLNAIIVKRKDAEQKLDDFNKKRSSQPPWIHWSQPDLDKLKYNLSFLGQEEYEANRLLQAFVRMNETTGNTRQAIENKILNLTRKRENAEKRGLSSSASMLTKKEDFQKVILKTMNEFAKSRLNETAKRKHNELQEDLAGLFTKPKPSELNKELAGLFNKTSSVTGGRAIRRSTRKFRIRR